MAERTEGSWASTAHRPRLTADLGRTAAAAVLVGAAYYLGARLGLSLSLVERNVTPLWPPSGIALAAFLILGRRMWPGVALAALAVNLPISTGPVPALLTALGNTLAPLVASIVLERIGFRRQLDRLRDALAIVFLGALASMTISATIGATTLMASKGTRGLAGAWAVWWTGDAMGVLAVAPFLLCIPLFWELEPWPVARWLEAGIILVLTIVLVSWTTRTDVQLLFLVLPLLGWASWRLQLRGAAPAALTASLIATWSATRDLGPFEGKSLLEKMLTLQAFNATVALTSFFLAALVTERIGFARALMAAAADLEVRVKDRTAELEATTDRLRRETDQRQETQQQLTREEARTRREHQIAETLQRSLLPNRMPEIPGLVVAARYVPATADLHVGGDWYDVIQLRAGLIGLVIGDVAGHGLQAAAAMTQLRMAVRAYAIHDPSPVTVMSRLHELARELPMAEMVTLLYVLYDPDTGTVRIANAGHPPALLIDDGSTQYLDGGLAPPLGVLAHWDYAEATHRLPPGATLLLYTDGLVEKRTLSIQDGLDRLLAEAQGSEWADLDALCDHLLSTLAETGKVADDIALIALRPLALAGTPLSLDVPAEARMLFQVRHALRRWLRESGVNARDAGEIAIACGEACSNVVRHAYGASPGDMHVEARLVDGSVELTVRDEGQWRRPADRGGGLGLTLIHGLSDSVDIDSDPEGTTIYMRRHVAVGDEK
ncbi:serine phosphatase RsbU (regulator of sigma subunit) [Kribbella rubisoli]|uniref:protein-serine/threonine phosphatase n=1 Tax=Kribbella rubisoli TaxID=3075929 RepID=A0A4V2FWK4_9ACTN|nr:SpoIIE family protein phosphatase [Kribbella rubisoli]RZU10176.1 serine phosphatase RsbU (regulator of sigma subunit) [Kribbella rubisoli]